MITRLKYNITFSSTGKSFSQDLNFKPGLTVITGANEAGKSLVLEMIEYSLFGVAALRGQSSDYSKLDVEMEFNVRGKARKVVRNGTTQTFSDPKATGAKAVNSEILRLLGLDLNVFRVSASSKQGELDRLTARMAPTERRKMVDELIGLNQLETVEKFCRSESNAQKRLRDDLAKRISEPVEPEKPEDYVVSLELDMALRKALVIQQEYHGLQTLNKPTLPVEPEKVNFLDDVEEHERLRATTTAERGSLERTLRSIPTATYTRQDIDVAQRVYAQADRGIQSEFTMVQLDNLSKDWDDFERQNQAVECPECGTHFIPGQDTVNLVPEPEISRKQIQEERQKLSKWEGYTYEDITTDIPRNQIESAIEALNKQDLRVQIESQLVDLPDLEDRSEELKLKQVYDREVISYNAYMESYVDKLTAWSDAQDRMSELETKLVDDVALENKLRISRDYEEQNRRYNADVVAFNDIKKELDELNTIAEDFYNGAEALKYVRSQVKAYLVPSLNKVASHLISEMTSGQRKAVVVDENFEVTVDGQPVRTLSGSGISVVNLALRIALGQVLTQTVVPIFLADEIDADCDQVRSEAVHTSLKLVAKTLEQVIVVSHKPLVGDNHIGV